MELEVLIKYKRSASSLFQGIWQRDWLANLALPSSLVLFYFVTKALKAHLTRLPSLDPQDGYMFQSGPKQIVQVSVYICAFLMKESHVVYAWS